MKIWKITVFIVFAVLAVVLSLQFISHRKEESSVQEIRIKGIQVHSEYGENNELKLDLKFMLEKPAKKAKDKKQLPLAYTIQDIIIKSDKDIQPSHPAGSDISYFFTQQSIKRKMHSRSMVKEFEELPVKELLQRIDQQSFFNKSNHLKLCFKEAFAEPADKFTVVLKLSNGDSIVQNADILMAQYH